MRLRELALARLRYGCRRLHVLLLREGWRVNHKKVLRLYREEELMIRTKRRKKRASEARLPLLPASRPLEQWSLDFMADRRVDGRKFRVLNAIDHYTRECVGIAVEASFPAEKVTAYLDRWIWERGKPAALVLDNGTEFTSNHFDAWA